MNLQTIAEHTLDIDLLPEKAKIIDAGCRGFLFTREMRRLNHYVMAIDVDDLSDDDEYFQIAISNYNGTAGISKKQDPNATSIIFGTDVKCHTLEWITDYVRFVDKENNSWIVVDMWDLIKLDIESSEYEVIMSMDRPYATQITVEFHLHCGQTEAQVKECVDKLHSLGYRTIQHEKTPRHGLKANYWDSLFCL